MVKIEIDINRNGERYSLDINGERVLATDKLSEIINRLEKEAKIIYGIKSGKLAKIGGLFGK